MKSKKWLISLGLAAILVVAFAIPACTPTQEAGWYTPEGEHIEFEISTTVGYTDVGLSVAEDLLNFGLNVTARALGWATYYQYLYEPDKGGMQAFISAEEPSLDPWSDWIWRMLSDPTDWGYLCNPCWYNNTTYNDLFLENYLAPNLTAKKEILYALQENVAENVPIVYLVRQDLISVNRNDNWEDWFDEMGGLITWINEYSIREVTPVGSETQLKIGTLTLMNNLNMIQSALTETNAGSLYLMMVYENLVGFPKVDEASLESNPDAAYDFIPKLATNYEVSYEDDGAGGQNQVWTIDLREGVKWQDYETEGIYLTADDVVYTMKYVLDKWLADMPVNWTAVEENNWDILSEHVLVEKTGDYRIKMTYVEGWHQSEDFFPSEFMWYAVVPEHIFNAEDAPENPLSWDGNSIGTGPYKVKEWLPDDYILFERFGDYWGAGDEYWGLPAAQQVLWKLYADIGSLFLALESGEIDAAMGTSAQFEKKAEYEANPDLTVEVVPDLSINYLGFNLHPTEGYAPLQDLTLRKAIAAAIDKENIVDIVFGGYGETCDAWTYNESPNHKPDLPNNEYDPTAARQMLLDAGYTYVE